MLGDDAVVWIDGDLKPLAEATVSVVDHGLVAGDAAFETLLILDGVPFAMSRHLNRLRRTLAALSIESPPDEFLRQGMCAAVTANALTEGRVRLTVTGGVGALGSGTPNGPATVVAAAEAAGSMPPPSAVTVPWTRNESGAAAGLKTTSYAENVRALRYAHDHQVGEALFANTKGELCEGTGTNVFVVVDGQVQTPPLSSGCLAGVTRELVIDAFAVAETAMPFEVLEHAEEIFLTSSTRDVQGLSRVDQRQLAAPGPITADVVSVFAALKAAAIDP